MQYALLNYESRNSLENFSMMLWYVPGIIGIFAVLLVLKKLGDLAPK